MLGSKAKATIVRNHKANELLQAPTLSPLPKSGGRDLSTDQPTRRPEQAVINSAAEALLEGQTHYVDVPGIAPLRERLAMYLKDMGLTGYEQANVLVTAGMQESRFLAIQMIGESYGSIALPEVVHPGARKAAGVRQIDVSLLPVDAEKGMLPTLASLRKALESGCSLLYLESPVRLSGAVFDAAAVAKIAALIEEFDAAVIWDQGLAPWVQNGQYTSLGAQPGMSERVAVLGEAWPGMGLESWFVGYVAANADWFESIRSQKQIISICTSTPSQFAALKAADWYASTHSEQLGDLARARDAALELVSGPDLVPLTGAVVNMIALRPSDHRRAHAALRQGGFGFADGADFGVQGVLRLAVTADDAIEKALELMV